MRRKNIRSSGDDRVQSLSLREAKVLDHAKRVAVVEYDFSSDGGAAGTYNLGMRLPADAVVTNIYSSELVALTSGGSATVQLRAGSTDLSTALAFDTGFAGDQSQALAGSATAIRISASSELNMVIAVAALTAGRVKFAVEYHLSK